ncbi:phosphatidate cytidylyltransferase [Compostibacillus humi]|uniref:Phosphatidate cytidylyltransferase n=1 Tax=Compostibacillus humi TaxID=1245525 RepID=A0A8J2ZQE8_9BACI|nr:phosphatidate cytidylyltransferase [Compostibacillus humi]GGH69704.1 phosphatidate cytidylyltransferase [Compostibacillus humi]HLT55523.1 phosphatidate cytidylyltransferase [Bacillota bacterium]
MKQRIITAILALIVFIPFVVYGKWPFTVFVFLIATLGFMELIRMRKLDSYLVPITFSVLLLWIILFPENARLYEDLHISKLELCTLLLLLLLAYTVLVKNKFTFEDAGFMLLSVFYVGIGFFFFLETRHGIDGLKNIIYALLVIWSTDTGAYFVGRAFGKRKLWPSISPNKTVEGAIGGIATACLAVSLFHLFSPFPHSFLFLIIVTMMASIFGQMGDLVESAFKRNYGVKDSGNVLPGHGGILDRFDSLLFVLPFLHIIQFM